MSQDLQRLIDVMIGDYVVIPDRPQEPPPLAIERQIRFEAEQRKLAALREKRLKRILK